MQRATEQAGGASAAVRSRPEIKARSIAMPKGGGAIVGLGESGSADEQSGSFNLVIPIDVPDARGLEPDLALSYASSDGQGIFGQGFAAATSGISRRTSSGIPRYDDGDTFLWGGTELCPVVPTATRDVGDQSYAITRYLKRVEQDFDLIERWVAPDGVNSFWRVISGDNHMTLYGRTAEARVADPADPGRVFEWLPEWEFDARGNAIRYRYKEEDAAGIARGSINEASRVRSANRYLERVCYGNDRPLARTPDGLGLPTDVLWHFELVFDYGEYSIDPSNDEPYQPVGPWLARPDPFSTYVAGFERRTYRLCRNVLTFHRFEALGPAPVLTRALSLSYSLDPGRSMLTAVTLTGYRYRASRPSGSRYATKSMPPLRFGYSQFNPAAARFVPFGGGRLPVPEIERPPRYSLIDMVGEGVPGVLYADRTSMLYSAPEAPREAGPAQVGYGPPMSWPQRPNLPVGDPTVQVSDLDGDGHQELLLTRPGLAGYFRSDRELGWHAFRPFQGMATDQGRSFSEFVDLTGDGLADLVQVRSDAIIYRESVGTGGYEGLAEAPNLQAVPPLSVPDPAVMTVFADLLGAGESQRVRLINGRIECWPSLGYGQFAPAVALDNAPRVDAPLDVAHVHLADLDGSGAADVVIAFADHLKVFFNQAGNGFAADPLILPLPSTYALRDQIAFADLASTGCQSLIFTGLDPQPSAWTFDFCNGQRPHLLCSIDNGMGGVTGITYASSVSFYLDDKKAGRPWLTSLPFPVQVVARIERADLVSGLRQVASYRYRHGYYDEVERRFRGFALVERCDTESVTDVEPGEVMVTPTLRRTWYHTGARSHRGPLPQLLAPEFFAKDDHAYAMPPNVCVWPAGFVPDPETLREAEVALAGLVLRSEVFGLDGGPNQDVPLSATQSNYTVRLLQPRAGPAQLASFLAHEREDIAYEYERMAHDPRVSHGFVLGVDDFGNVTQSCEIFYARRPGQDVDDPQQAVLRVRCGVFTLVPPQLAQDVMFHGLPQAEQSFEIGNIAAQAGYFEFADLSQLVAAALAAGDGGKEGQPSARLLSWDRWSYAKEGGTITPQALLINTETAEFNATAVAALLAPARLPDDLSTMLSGAGGYSLADGYWWRAGPTESYAGADHFFVPESTADVFAARQASPAGTVTTYVYDAYDLLLAAIETASSGGDVLTDRITTTRADYQNLVPLQIQDGSGRISEVRLDPLGMVIATSHRGLQQVNGAAVGVGFTALPDPDEDWPQPVSAADVIANPAAYLQGAGSYSYEDVGSWLRDGTPCHTIELEATEYPDAAHPATPVGDVRIKLSYEDGMGRIVQTIGRVESGLAILTGKEGRPAMSNGTFTTGPVVDRWLASGASIYNSRGQSYRAYQPFYVDDWRFVDDPALRRFGSSPTSFYDALFRLIRTAFQKGAMTEAFFSSIERTPWTITTSDQNDNVKQSAYYRAYVDPGTAQPPLGVYDKDALVKAAAHDGTPSTQVLSCDGHVVRTIERPSTDPADALVTLRMVDIQGRTTAVADPRFGAAGLWNLRLYYGLGEVAVATASADAGTSYVLADAMDKTLLSLDARGFLVTNDYDGAHRLTTARVRDLSANSPTPRVAERVIYGDSLDQQGRPPFADSDGRNLRGQIWLHYDGAGRVEVPAHALSGSPLGSSQQFAADARIDPDWSANLAAGWTWSDLTATLAPGLATEIFASRFDYNALDEPFTDDDAGGNRTRLERHVSGRLKAIYSTPGGGAEFCYVQDIAYDASNQRASLSLGAPAGTGPATQTYDYDPDTLRLVRQRTVRSADAAVLQDLTYYYDPVSNVTHVSDQSALTGAVGYNAPQVSPDCDYTFDALYRLLAATGRAHQALTKDAEADGGYAQVFAPGANLNDSAAVEAYLMRYSYDRGGNLTTVRYISPGSSSSARWTRNITVSPNSNRAVDADALGSGAVDSWFDAAGNQLRTAGVPALIWNYRSELACAIIVDRGKTADPDAKFSTYDATGKRIRTLVQRKTAAPQLETEETLYLGSLEITRRRQGGTIVSESRRLRLMDAEDCVAELLSWPIGPPAGVASSPMRYQISDAQGSSAMETDAAGKLISYEAYAPYGSTVYATGASLAEVSLKRYRYSGERRDQPTGLYYYGSRYYAPWIGRWLSPDPGGTMDGLNLYAFLGGNPVTFVDPDGRGKQLSKKAAAAAKAKKVSHASLHSASEAIGVMIANEMGKDTTSVDHYKQKYQAIMKEAGAEPIHNENKVIEAIQYGLAGDSKKFGEAYRAAAKGTDEHLSTTTVFHVLKGIGSTGKAMSKANQEKLYYAVKIASVFRLPTEQSGYNFGNGNSMMHPKSPQQDSFDRSAKNHGSHDLERRAEVVKAGNDGTGFTRLLNMAAEGALHTLTDFSAPASASNMKFQKPLASSFKRKWTKRRELVKRQWLVLKGHKVKTYARQKETAPWRGRSKTSGSSRKRSASPLRE